MTIPVILTNKQSATLQGFERQEKNLERQLYKEQAKEMGPSPTAPERKPVFFLAEDNCACLRIGYFFMVEAFTSPGEGHNRPKGYGYITETQ